ncbi:hypothetical protein PMI31_03136 [Pseudomonas sp. GM55]|nr:hypothetical protein PMI31_03136 [Pseudomonas sp. GM55]
MDTRAVFLLKSEVKGHVRTDVSVTGDKLWCFLGAHEWKVLHQSTWELRNRTPLEHPFAFDLTSHLHLF